MRLAGIVLLAAACGGPQSGPARVEVVSGPPDAAVPTATAEPEPEDSLLDWSQASWTTDDEAMALWTAIGINGDNYQILLGEIPRAPAGAMARALLRQGNFACPATTIATSCESVTQEFLAVPPEATIDDPCLRRRLALWALDTLDDQTLTSELIADVIALAALPPPEDELNRGAMYRVQDEGLRLQMIDAAMRAGNEELANESIGGLSVAGLEAAAAMHIDAAVDSLGAESTKALAAATLDAKLRTETRVRAVQDLAYYYMDTDPMDPARQDAYDAVVAASKTADCAVSGAALVMLGSLGDTTPLASPPKHAKPPAMLRYMCQVIAGGGDEYGLWDKITDERGVVVRHLVRSPDRVKELWEDYPDAKDADKDGAPDVPEADPDGDGDPTTVLEVQHYAQDDWREEAPYLDDLRRVLAACQGTTCHLAATRAQYVFKFRKSKKTLVLDAIEIEETAGGC